MKITEIKFIDKYKITKILKHTTAKMFKNCKVDDILEFCIAFCPVGSNRTTYSSYVNIRNLRTNERTNISINQSANYNKLVELEKIE